VLSLAGLITWYFYESMGDRTAQLAIAVPLMPAVIALFAAATRQTYIHKVNDAIIKED
jgi:hypothetical protein